jgi:hypothetical protein
MINICRFVLGRYMHNFLVEQSKLKLPFLVPKGNLRVSRLYFFDGKKCWII